MTIDYRDCDDYRCLLSEQPIHGPIKTRFSPYKFRYFIISDWQDAISAGEDITKKTYSSAQMQP